jgi:PAS domain S-box-containing protein
MGTEGQSRGATILRLRILVVDDEPAHAEAIRRELESSDAKPQVRVATSLAEYHGLVAEFSPDLALIDFLLPDGEATSVLRSPPEEATFPIVMMTSHGNENIAVEAMRQGAIDYVVKSVDAFRQMPHTVEKAMRAWAVLKDRQQTRSALQHSEARYRLLVENSQEAIYVLQDARFKFVNRKCLELAGLAEAEMLRRSILDFVPEPDRQLVHMQHQHVCSSDGSAQSQEIRFTLPHGEERWMSVNAVRIEWEGRPATLNFATDITERRRAELALRRWADAFEHCAHGIAIGVPGINRVLVCNPALARMLQRSVQEINGMPIVSLYTPEYHQRLAAWIAEADRVGQVRYEACMVRADGSSFPVQMDIVSVLDKDGKTKYRVATAQDISQQKQTLENLRQSEQRFRDISFSTADWVWEVDPEGRYTFASESVEHLLGYRPEEILGRTPFDLMPKPEAERVSRLFCDIASARRPFSGLENTNLHKSGRLVVLETSGVPVFDASGNFQGYRGMDRDITARKQLEAQLRQAQKLEAVGQLAGGVAHDFNNILAAIMMQLNLLQMNQALDRKTLSALDELQEEAQRAAGLTRQLLMFSRRAVLDVKPLDVDAVVENLLKMLRRLIGENVDLQFGRRTALPLVEADAGMIEQVLMNLVVNARDAMPRGGTIKIATTAVAFPPASIPQESIRRGGRFVCLAVSDTGDGMDAETLKRIFEPFFTTKEVGKGTGLGLATVHGIAAQHKGWVEVDSAVGAGSTFRVYLPAIEQSSASAAPRRELSPLVGGKETILVVEDQPKVRRLIALTLRAQGYAVHEAGTGQEAIAVWQQHQGQIDLLFTDMIMPEGLTGLELTERLRAAKPGLKAIISSGYSAEIAQKDAIDKAGVIYLAKPYEAQTLTEVVRRCLDAQEHPQKG